MIAASELRASDLSSELRVRFIQKLDYQGEYACWPWTGSKSSQGYGQFNVNGRSTTAQRAAIAVFGGDIPNGMTVDHLCGNPSCVNPRHLEVVTHRENLRRSKTSACAMNRDKTHCPVGHDYAIYRHPKSGRVQRYCPTCKREKVREWMRRHRAALRQEVA